MLGLAIISAFLLAITIHEFMHAWTANYLGDPTARLMGRISLNPIKHLDPFGTILLLLVGFGWGKPVQVNDNNFKNPRLGSAIVSLAGPMSNLFVVLVFTFFLKFGFVTMDIFHTIFVTVIYVNIVLMVFNLIPIPPLDGSKVLYYFLPRSVNIMQLETYGPILLIVIFLLERGLLFGLIGFVIQAYSNLFGVSIF